MLRGMGFATFLAEASGDHDAVKQINGLALAHAQAIVHVLESSGYTITHRDDPKPVDTVGMKVASIQCNRGRLLVQLAVDDNLHAHVNGKAFIEAAKSGVPACPASANWQKALVSSALISIMRAKTSARWADYGSNSSRCSRRRTGELTQNGRAAAVHGMRRLLRGA
jgi:hypothetical protein